MYSYMYTGGWSGGAMVLGKIPVPGRPTNWMIVGQGPIALAIGAGGGCLDIFTLLCPFSLLSPSFLDSAQYRLKYCIKGPLNQKQPTNQLRFWNKNFLNLTTWQPTSQPTTCTLEAFIKY